MTGIPASDLIPAAFGSAKKPDWIFTLRDIPMDQSRKFFLSSQFSRGYQYYTENGDIRLSEDFPTNYADDIGYAYKHGPGKVDDKGNPMEDRAHPSEVWIARAWLVEEERMVTLKVDSNPLMKSFHKLFQDSNFMLQETGIANFYITIYRESGKDGAPPKYDATASLRPLMNDTAYEQATKPFYPENYWQNLNPMEPAAEPPATKAAPARKPRARDENGADMDIAIKNSGDSYKW